MKSVIVDALASAIKEKSEELRHIEEFHEKLCANRQFIIEQISHKEECIAKIKQEIKDLTKALPIEHRSAL